ncbi:hypothetical protein BKA01_001770 [Pseudonocardia eucalypti]|uniref:class V lanthionine synthetase subunit LxmK n=1 Tax=Pseudonocardia eucalypti TaxID=648755 RepID=UPI0017BC1AB5|nr:hypothetical protein [Pseudonocardia eucalypti]
MVERFLTGLGFGVFDRSGLTAPYGRNDVWAGPTSTGDQIFVKRLSGRTADVVARMRRLHLFEEVFRAQPGRPFDVPEYLGRDLEHGLVAYRMITGATGGAGRMVDETFDDAMARQTGEAVASVHAMVVPDGIQLDGSLPDLPSLDLVNGLPLAVYENVSHGELEAWRLQQNDLPLVRALAGLRQREVLATRVPAHCDLRVDQLLFSGGRLVLTDWEEFRLADPARDVGSFAGEWLYRSVLDIVTPRGGASPDGVGLDHHAVLRLGVAKLERLRPRIESFWSGYRSVSESVNSDFMVRATAFAGWHMLDRLLAGSAYRGLLSGIERAAAGIGRNVLLNPERFASAIGLAS